MFIQNTKKEKFSLSIKTIYLFKDNQIVKLSLKE